MFWGGVLIMLGNGCSPLATRSCSSSACIVIVFGVGLLKPNISAIVAQLYPEGGSRRDAGFSIFYMGINLGAFLGSMLVPDRRRAAAAGTSASRCRRIGMVLGLVQFQVDQALPRRRRRRAARRAARRWWPVVGFVDRGRGDRAAWR